MNFVEEIHEIPAQDFRLGMSFNNTTVFISQLLRKTFSSVYNIAFHNMKL
jgi:hypothetical protein